MAFSYLRESVTDQLSQERCLYFRDGCGVMGFMPHRYLYGCVSYLRLGGGQFIMHIIYVTDELIVCDQTGVLLTHTAQLLPKRSRLHLYRTGFSWGSLNSKGEHSSRGVQVSLNVVCRM